MEFSITEMLVIGLVALLLYGGRLPKVALAVGRAIGELKKGLRETSDMVRFEVEDSAPTIHRRPSRLGTATRYGEYEDDPPDDPAMATEDITLGEQPESAPEAEAGAEAVEPPETQ